MGNLRRIANIQGGEIPPTYIWGDEMFTLNDDLSIYATRGDIVFFSVTAEEDGKNYKFRAGDVVRIKVYGKKDAENVILQKDFPVTEITESVEIFLTKEDMKIGEVISKHKDYWYEVVLNDDTLPQTIIGYDEDGAKLFRLFPEGDDIPPYEPIEPEDIPLVDDELDVTSTRPVQNQAVAKAVARIEDICERTNAAVAERYVTPEMFGAIGDGESDDTEALQKALNSGNSVMLATSTYRTTDTLIVPMGCAVIGDRNSVISPDCAVAFHLKEKTTLTGFSVQVNSEKVLTVFEVNDESKIRDSMLEITIENMSVTNSLNTIPEKYTVCHFHTLTEGVYNIAVRGCTFDNNGSGGYVARVYNEGNSWISTVIFDGNYTRGFEWHYFFDKSDTEFVNTDHNNKHIVTNCVAQCRPETNGFIFMSSPGCVSFHKNIPWDWGASTGSVNCPGSPIVIGANVATQSATLNVAYAYNEINYINDVCVYDGTTFTALPYNRQDVLSGLGGRYNHNLIPKYIGLPRNKAVCLYSATSTQSSRRVRFYWCDTNGITYVSVRLAEGKVRVSQPLHTAIRFGLSEDGKRLYVYRSDGEILQAYCGVMTLPVANNVETFSAGGSVSSVEHTINIENFVDTCCFDALPEAVTELPILLSQPSYVSDSNGVIYKLGVADDGSEITITRAYGPSGEV